MSLTTPKHRTKVHAIESLKRHDFVSVVAASANFDEEIQQIRQIGVDTAFNLYAEAGADFANHVYNGNQQRPDLTQGSWKTRQESED